MGFEKKLECEFCKVSVRIKDANFPEDLYDLILKHQVNQLFWCCNNCNEKKYGLSVTFLLEMSKKQEQMQQQLSDLNKAIQDMQKHKNELCSFTWVQDTETEDMGNSHSEVPDHSDDSSAVSIQSANTSVVLENRHVLLEDILVTKIRIDPDQATRSRKIVTEFLEELTTHLKNIDPIFKQCFQKIYYTGSSYEELRVKSADEYDINLILKLPFKLSDREIEYANGVKAFAKYKLKMESSTDENAAVVKKFFRDNYLLHSELKKWMQSIITKAIHSKKLSVEHVLTITDFESGPARTVKLETSYGYDIDIDLVPVIQLTGQEWPEFADKSRVKKFSVPSDDQFWFLVPKEYKCRNRNLSVDEISHLWRIHIPNVEKKVLYNIGCAKPVVKVLKLLRDKQDWKALASYYLKTVVMYHVEENPDSNYWKKNYMDERLKEVLRRLSGYLKNRNLPSFFFADHNLIQNLADNSAQAENIDRRLNRIINAIERDFTKIAEYL